MEVKPEQIQAALDALDHAFDWELSPQGWTYWETVYDNLDEMLRKHTAAGKTETEESKHG